MAKHHIHRTPALAIFNEKGGVGKTFFAASIAEWAARFLGLDVLLVDTDIQCNLTALMVGLEFVDLKSDGITYRVPPVHPDFDSITDKIDRPSVSACFLAETVMPYPTWLSPETNDRTEGRVEVLAAHGEKLEHIVSDSHNIADPIYHSVFNVIQSDYLADVYDLVILDTNPNRNLLARSVLRAASHVLIPMEFDVHCIDGIRSALSSIAAENQYREQSCMQRLELVGLLPNRFVKGSARFKGLSQLNLEELESVFGGLFLSRHSFIPQAEVVKKVLSGKHISESIFDISRKSKTEYRLRIALEHACIEILRSTLPPNFKSSNALDRHEQRTRREQKKYDA